MMSNLTEYAKRELESFGAMSKDEDFYGGATGKAVMELVEVFSAQGHSGMSAGIVRQLFNRVSDFQPLRPLTGDDSEWVDVGEGIFQNNRCCEVFKDGKDGDAYHSGGRVFVEPNGYAYTNRESKVLIDFPYVPKKIYVKVNENGEELADA